MAKKAATKRKAGGVKYLKQIPNDPPTGLLFFETEIEEINSVFGSVEFKEGLVKLKSKFNQEIQELSRRYGVTVETKALFKVTNNLKG